MIETVKGSLLLNAGATSTTSTASTSAHVSDARFGSLYVLWTPGANNNVLTLKLEFSPSESNVSDTDAVWVQDDTWTLSSTHYSSTVVDVQITAVGTTQHKRRYDVSNIACKRFRVKYDETVSAGVLTLEYLSKAI